MSLLWHYRELVWAAIAWAAYATVIVLVVLAVRRPKREPEEGLDPGSLAVTEPWPIEWDAYGHARPVDPEQAETLAHLRRAMPRKFEPKLKEEA